MIGKILDKIEDFYRDTRTRYLEAVRGTYRDMSHGNELEEDFEIFKEEKE